MATSLHPKGLLSRRLGRRVGEGGREATCPPFGLTVETRVLRDVRIRLGAGVDPSGAFEHPTPAGAQDMHRQLRGPVWEEGEGVALAEYSRE